MSAVESTPGARPRSWRRLVLLLIAGLVLVLVGGAAAVLAGRDDDGPAARFERAAAAFHQAYNPAARALDDSLAKAADRFADPSFAAVTVEANRAGDAFASYGVAIRAIPFPAAAQPAAKDLAEVTDFGRTLMANTANSFAASTAKSLVERHRAPAESALAAAEKALRAAL
jgi:hypothetical protein